jgi:hypothetical protein
MTDQPSSTGEISTPNGTNGFWKGKTEARIDGLVEDMREVKGDVKSVHQKLDAIAEQWSHLPCHDPTFVIPATSDCPPGHVQIGGRLAPPSGDRLASLFEGWKGRIMFLVTSGVISIVTFGTIWIFIMSSSRVQAIMKVADSLAGGK